MTVRGLTSAAGAAFLFGSSDAAAASGVTVEGALLTLLAVGGVFWLAFAFIGPFRRTMLRIPRDASGSFLMVLGVLSLLYAATSAVLGKTWVGASVVLRVVDPNWFWLIVKFEAGVGAALVILGLISPRRRK